MQSTYQSIQSAVKSGMLESLKHYSTHNKMTMEKVLKNPNANETGKHFNI